MLDNKEAEEGMSDMSNASLKKLSVLFYQLVINDKGKPHRKSRRCVLCSQLFVAHCSCCEKDYCYPVGSKKHNRTCMVDYIKHMKRRLNQRTTRSNAK